MSHHKLRNVNAAVGTVTSQLWIFVGNIKVSKPWKEIVEVTGRPRADLVDSVLTLKLRGREFESCKCPWNISLCSVHKQHT